MWMNLAANSALQGDAIQSKFQIALPNNNKFSQFRHYKQL